MNSAIPVEAELGLLREEISNLKITCIKLEAERDAVVELYKLLMREVINGTHTNKET
jgi:hypothetical protein